MLKIKQFRFGVNTVTGGLYEAGVGVWVGDRLYPIAKIDWLDVEPGVGAEVGTESGAPTRDQPPAGPGSGRRRRIGGGSAGA